MLNIEQSVEQPTYECIQNSMCQQMLRGCIALSILGRHACLPADMGRADAT